MIWLVWLLGLFSLFFVLIGLAVVVAEFLPGSSSQDSKQERGRALVSGFACIFLGLSSGGYVLMRSLPPPEVPQDAQETASPTEDEVKVGDTVMYLANKRSRLKFEQLQDQDDKLWWYSPVTNETYVISKTERKVLEVLKGQQVK